MSTPNDVRYVIDRAKNVNCWLGMKPTPNDWDWVAADLAEDADSLLAAIAVFLIEDHPRRVKLAGEQHFRVDDVFDWAWDTLLYAVAISKGITNEVSLYVISSVAASSTPSMIEGIGRALSYVADRDGMDKSLVKAEMQKILAAAEHEVVKEAIRGDIEDLGL